MDCPPDTGSNPEYRGYDLLILHHPPATPPAIPAYVIHTNWDLLPGGACDALADALCIDTGGVLDEETGLGRTGTHHRGPVSLLQFVWDVMGALRVPEIRVVNFQKDRMIEQVALVSGFGLNPALIRTAHERGADLYLSGDLTHAGAMLAKELGIVLVDATHHATEVPGLYRLGELLSGIGPAIHVRDTGIPWCVISKNKLLK
jgi:Uncharacterized conserved protein